MAKFILRIVGTITNNEVSVSVNGEKLPAAHLPFSWGKTPTKGGLATLCHSIVEKVGMTHSEEHRYYMMIYFQLEEQPGNENFDITLDLEKLVTDFYRKDNGPVELFG